MSRVLIAFLEVTIGGLDGEGPGAGWVWRLGKMEVAQYRQDRSQNPQALSHIAE